MDIAQWMKENDIPVKIRAALEQAVNGQAWSLFEGLQHGHVIMKLSYDGVNINLERMSKATPEMVTKSTDTSTLSTLTAPFEPQPVVDDPPNMVEETQTRRKGRHGSRNETE